MMEPITSLWEYKMEKGIINKSFVPIEEKEDQKVKGSKLSKISQTMRKALDCCKE